GRGEDAERAGHRQRGRDREFRRGDPLHARCRGQPRRREGGGRQMIATSAPIRGGQMLAGIALVLACALAATAKPGVGQQGQSSRQGFSMNRDQPVRIESNTLEVRDKIRQATFIGDVKLTQGDTTLKCRTLVVFYEDTPAAKKGGAAAPQ